MRCHYSNANNLCCIEREDKIDFYNFLILSCRYIFKLANLSFFMAKFFVYYVLLLLFHMLHVVEEIFGKAYFIESFYGGLRNFLLIMALLWIVPAILLYFLLKRNKAAIYLSFIYPIILVIDGLDHIIEFFIIEKYFNGAAGLFTGIAFLPLGLLLIISLRRHLYSA